MNPLTIQTILRVEYLLPRLLLQPEIWRGKDILYHAPRVERIYTDQTLSGRKSLGDNRISLHIIYPTDEQCLFHPHPWPSVIKIVHGGYEMGVGYGEGLETPPEACKLLLTAGSIYAMLDPDGWHYVKPATSQPNLSVMISGAPWGREMPIENIPDGANKDMTPERIGQIIATFQTFYPSPQSATPRLANDQVIFIPELEAYFRRTWNDGLVTTPKREEALIFSIEKDFNQTLRNIQIEHPQARGEDSLWM